MIYVDNAATTQLDPEALEAMMPYLRTEYGNASQPYAFSRSAKKALIDARKIIATCINASPDEIYFTSGGTESDNWALKGTMFVSKDKHILITSQIEHHAILHSAQFIEKMGYHVIYLPADEKGSIHPEDLRNCISKKTKLVSVMMANNEVGSIQPIKDLAAIAHQAGALFHTDAVQAVGHIPIDVKYLDIDMLSASAHKFNGPKGVGFLYIKKGTPIDSYTDGGSQEMGMRAGTENVASIVGMACALKKNVDLIQHNENYLIDLESRLLNRLTIAGIDFIRNGSANHIPGNISLSFKNISGEALLHRLDLMKICVSTGSACDSKNTQVSHVLEAMQLPKEYARGTIRISLCKNNTNLDIEIIAEALIRIVKDRQ